MSQQSVSGSRIADLDASLLTALDPVLAVSAACQAHAPPAEQANAVVPAVPAGLNEPQLAGYSYGSQPGPYGSNVASAWRYSSGAGVVVGLVDEGFDPATTATFGNFSTALSRPFDGSGSVAEPAGGFHGTTTSGLIGATGVANTPEGVAPNGTIVGVKVAFGTGTIGAMAQAEQYAASVSSVVNNSWAYMGYGVGEPTDPAFGVWYAAIEAAVASDRAGLGAVITFAAGNDAASANDLAVQPVTADYRVIAVAATDAATGAVASYSTQGAGLLVAAVGDAVAVAATGGSGNEIGSGTSYAAPTVAAIAAMMLGVNPNLGWRDVQEILADASYMPPPGAAGFTYNAAADWNGGGRHFSNAMGYGVVDANIAVNLARAWTGQSTSANVAAASAAQTTPFTVADNGTASSAVAATAAIRIQHVQISITDTYLPAAWSRIVLVSPAGTQSVLVNQTGLISGQDNTNGLDLSGRLMTSNAFWGEQAAGTWTLQVQDNGGATVGTVESWGLTFIGDATAAAAPPLVYTPEFAAVATPTRAVVTPGSATTIDLIGLPGVTSINLNGGGGTIDGVAVTVGGGLRNANADGSTGSATLIGRAQGGSELSGGDGVSALVGYGGDTINASLGTTTIQTNAGGSLVTLSGVGASSVAVASGGGDTIYAGLANTTISDTGARGDSVYGQSANLNFINGSGVSVVTAGSGAVLVQAGIGGGTYYAGLAGNNHLTAGSGLVTFFGAAAGDVLTAAGSAADILVAGAGSETLSGGASTGSIILQAGSGPDAMIAGQGSTTFLVGAGGGSIAVGGLHDIIQIQAGMGGGLNIVSGFQPGIADLHLVNFAASEAASAISGQTLDGQGGTLLTFSDNTRMDLLGVGHVAATAFV